MRELINEGLRQRQKHGVAAALPFFERAAQLEPNSHLPFFMLGNARSELGDLDAAVHHLAHARDLQPNEHMVRFNLGLNHLLRGYVDAGIKELRASLRSRFEQSSLRGESRFAAQFEQLLRSAWQQHLARNLSQ